MGYLIYQNQIPYFAGYLQDKQRRVNLLNNDTTLVVCMIKLNRELSVRSETKNILSQIIIFNEWDRTKDLRPINIQTIDKTMVKPGGVVRN